MKRQALALLLASAALGLLAGTYIDTGYAYSDDSQYESAAVRVAKNPIGEVVR